MRFIHVGFFALLVTVFSTVSCIRQQQTSGMITESKALKLAEREFAKTGRKVDDYGITMEPDSSGQKWVVWFDRKGAYATPGGKHAITVERATGKVAFMPGE